VGIENPSVESTHTVGAEVGMLLLEGLALGADEGAADGLAVGADVGLALGADEGAADGLAVGADVGLAVGADEGESVGHESQVILQ
jgi:hypothetical protein